MAANWYSTHIYPITVSLIGRITGIFPFSVAEILIYILIIWSVISLVRASRKKDMKRWVKKLLLVAGILFLLYVLNCGINYHRISFAESADFQLESYSVQDLKETCLWLTDEVNALSGKVERDKSGQMILNGNERTDAVTAMEKTGEYYPELAGFYPRPKAVLNHKILSAQKLTGIYSPFTIEANYNSGMTDYNVPFTQCHELSHLRGFMQEEEANFIAFLACRISENNEFQYSGNLLAWIKCMNLLYKMDYEAWEEIRPLLAAEVEKDLQANNEFWRKYDGKVAEVSNQINDTYLKANGQKDGVESYNRMVDLVVSYYLKEIEL